MILSLKSDSFFAPFSIAYGHMGDAMEKKRCPVSTGGLEENNKPLTFLESLTLTSQLQSEQVVGITTDLFIAGIDSVSYFIFMSFSSQS